MVDVLVLAPAIVAPSRSRLSSTVWAARHEGLFGYFAYALLWLFVSGVLSGGVVALLVSLPMPMLGLAFGAMELVCWLLYLWWFIVKTKSTRGVFERGEWFDGTVTSVVRGWSRRGPHTGTQRCSVRFRRNHHEIAAVGTVPWLVNVSAGTPIHVLYLAGAAPCAGFVDGRFIALTAEVEPEPPTHEYR